VVAVYQARYEGSCPCGDIDVTVKLDGIPNDRHPEHQLAQHCLSCNREFVLYLVEFGSELTDTGLRGPDDE
jgi:hypothetical protein